MRNWIIIVIIFGLNRVDTVQAQNFNADSLLDVAIGMHSKAQFGEAKQWFRRVSEYYLQKNDTVGWVKTNLSYGESLVSWGQVKEGLSYFLKVDSLNIKNLPLVLKGSTKSDLGWAYRLLEQYDLAQEYYKEGIKIAEDSGDSLLIGRLNNNISYTYQNLGDYETALKYQMIAKKIYEDAGNDVRLSYVLNGIFLSLTDLGLDELAAPYVRKSLAIREKIGNKQMLDVSYHNMALSFFSRGVLDSAVIHYNKSLEITRELNNPYEITVTLNNIGLVYDRMGKYNMAIEYYEEALEINRELNRPSSITLNLMNLGGLSFRKGDLEAADRYFNEALKWIESVSAPKRLTNLYLKIIDLKLTQKKYTEAEEYLKRAEDITVGLGLIDLEARVHELMGKRYFLVGELEKSLKEYRRSYQIATGLSSSNNVGSTIQLAKAYHRLKSDSSYILAEKAFDQIAELRNNVTGLTFKAGLFRDYADFYNEVALWHLRDEKNAVKALELVESAKARVLLDELAEAENKIYGKLDEWMLIKKQRLAKGIDQSYKAIDEARTIKAKDSLRNELKDQKFRYQTFLNEMRGQIPEWKNFEYPKPLSTEDIQYMLGPNTAFVEYAFAGDILLRFVITNDEIMATTIDSLNGGSAKQELTDWVRKYREEIKAQKSPGDLEKSSASFLSTLLPPHSEFDAADIKQFVIIPDGPLSYLPFEAIRESGKYLIERYNIKYLPSASIYNFIRSPHRETSFDLLALAGSGFNGAEGERVKTNPSFMWPSLPLALIEVDSISANFGKVKVLKNEQMTESALMSLSLDEFKYIHFATHADVNEEDPSQSGMVLSANQNLKRAPDEDDFLNSGEISSLTLNAELATLSACNTAMGELVSGEGLLGLQRSFLTAGASSVMVSLWSVYDRSTSIFMTSFYKEMLRNQESDFGWVAQAMNRMGVHEHPMFDYKTKALRKAKIDMIQHPYYHDPIYWAPFILIGK